MHADVFCLSCVLFSQCLTLVQSKFPEANAAEFSNTAGEGCAAVFDACAPAQPPHAPTPLLKPGAAQGGRDLRPGPADLCFRRQLARGSLASQRARLTAQMRLAQNWRLD